MKPATLLAVSLVLVAGAVAAVLFWPKAQDTVTIYCALDETHSKPILEAFERETGIHVSPQFDVEATKTVGLVEKIRSQRAAPACDVFWNNEILHTIRLANDGLLLPYSSPSAADIPAEFKDPEGRWTGFAARARILIVNTSLVPDAERPTSMQDFVDPRWKGRASLARPLTGTTLTHAAVLYTVLGREKALAWFEGLHGNDCHFTPGNGPVARAVANAGAEGRPAFGFTDTDDFRKMQLDKYPVVAVYPDQGDGQPGTLLIPNTIAVIRGGPRTDLGMRLVDYVLAKSVEGLLAQGDGAQIPLRGDVPRPDHVKGPPAYRAMKVDWADVAAHYDERHQELSALWSR